jgi:hypothetical protein
LVAAGFFAGAVFLVVAGLAGVAFFAGGLLGAAAGRFVAGFTVSC